MKTRNNTPSFIPSLLAAGLLSLFSMSFQTQAAVTGRYVRIENPTGPYMEWQEIEVMSGGANLVAGKAKMVKSSGAPWPDIFVNGKKDVKIRGCGVKAPTGESLNPWLELDLGKESPIEEIILYGSQLGQRIHMDKGHRAVSILSEERKVEWVAKFDYMNRKRFPDGIYAFKPTAGDSNPFAGKVVPADAPAWIPITWLLDIGNESLPPDSESRMREFAQRDSPGHVKALADEFFAVIEPDISGLAEARTLYQQGKYQEALEEWKTYWFAKMAKVNRHVAFDGGNYYHQGAGRDLLENIRITIAGHSIRGDRFTPGRIHWVNLPSDSIEIRNALADAGTLALVNVMPRPLLKSYWETGDPRFLAQWAKITDDWSLNFFRDADACKLNAKELFVMTPADHWGLFMEEVSDLAVKRPEAVKLIPATTLARLQLTCMDQYGPAYWRVARNNVFNHMVSALGAWFSLLPYIDEFAPGRRIEKEWRQNLARWMTQGMEPDGSMVEIGDEGHLTSPTFSGLIFERLQNLPGARPAWYTRGFENRAMEYYDSANYYVFRHAAPGGYGHRLFEVSPLFPAFFDYRFSKINGPHPLLDRRPVVHAQPEVRRILDACCGVSAGRVSFDPKTTPGYDQVFLRGKQDVYDRAVAILGNDKPGMPKINSDWMPYTGSYYFRGGWQPKDSFLAMVAYGSKGGALPRWQDVDFGYLYTYDYNYPLLRMYGLRIDGKRQNPFYPSTTYRPGSKTWFLAFAEREPAPFRWHSSERFDYGEAIYHGAYQNLVVKNLVAPGDKIPGTYNEVDFSQPAIEKVCAERRVIHLRKQRLFIVAEALSYKNTETGTALHDYSAPLTVMLTTKGKDAGQLLVDAARKQVSSANPDTPNGFLRQFTELPVTYSPGAAAKKDSKYYAARLGADVAVAHQTVSANWKASGSFALVNLLSSAEQGKSDPVQRATPLNKGNEISGFHAELADGTQIWCQAVVGQARELICGPIKTVAETLLLVKEPSGALRGLVLGRRKGDISTALNGLAFPGNASDFEFAFAQPDSSCSVIPIFTPVVPVEFSPDINTFIDQQTVILTSKTPNVEIHYTTDGTQPTLKSPRYTQPVVIAESTEFAARAWRLGDDGRPLPTLSGEDFEINGTRFTVPTYGWFYKRPNLLPAAKVEGKLVPGLRYDLYHGQWTKLWNRARWLKPESSGTVKRDLDLPAKETDYFAIIYKGYLEIPEDGLYTFHAPRELVMCDNAASYDLRLSIDGEEWDLTQWWYGLGTWSIPLAAGLHRFQLEYADARSTPYKSSGLFLWYPTLHAINPAPPSPILVSGPGMTKARIPQNWLKQEVSQ